MREAKQSLRQVVGAARRSQILDAAIALIGERGYYGFGLQELAGQCGMTKPGLLHHFGSKDQLLLALLRERDQQNEAAVNGLLNAEVGSSQLPEVVRRRMRDALHLISSRNAARPELLRLQVVLRAEAINPGHPAHAYFVAREAAKQELLAQGLAVFMADPQAAARQILGLLSGLEEQWLRTGREFDLVADCDHAIAVLLEPSKAPDGGREQ